MSCFRLVGEYLLRTERLDERLENAPFYERFRYLSLGGPVSGRVMYGQVRKVTLFDSDPRLQLQTFFGEETLLASCTTATARPGPVRHSRERSCPSKRLPADDTRPHRQ